jgi:hypothetical protein
LSFYDVLPVFVSLSYQHQQRLPETFCFLQLSPEVSGLAGFEPSNLKLFVDCPINCDAAIGPFVRDLLDEQVEVFGLVFAEVAGMSKLPLLVEVDDVLCQSQNFFFLCH